jgi:hypothetical protein
LIFNNNKLNILLVDYLFILPGFNINIVGFSLSTGISLLKMWARSILVFFLMLIEVVALFEVDTGSEIKDGMSTMMHKMTTNVLLIIPA